MWSDGPDQPLQKGSQLSSHSVKLTVQPFSRRIRSQVNFNANTQAIRPATKLLVSNVTSAPTAVWKYGPLNRVKTSMSSRADTCVVRTAGCGTIFRCADRRIAMDLPSFGKSRSTFSGGATDHRRKGLTFGGDTQVPSDIPVETLISVKGRKPN